MLNDASRHLLARKKRPPQHRSSDIDILSVNLNKVQFAPVRLSASSSLYLKKFWHMLCCSKVWAVNAERCEKAEKVRFRG